MRRYAIVGTGARGYFMFGQAIVERFASQAVLAGLCDPNSRRARYVQEQLQAEVPVYQDFDAMVREQKPDVVIITTVDRFHPYYIRRAFELGCDVICEKPIAVNREGCLDILDAEQEHNRKIAVTFNCRFMPYFSQIKALLMEQPIGEIYNVHFEYMLDRSHGADYFRRWHREMDQSGGLLVHKATHHFDIVNWFLEADPVTVSAHGALRYYGPNRREYGQRCTTCPHRSTCDRVFRDGDVPYIRHMYFEAEQEDGYFRDRCVFSPEIDIYDTMSLTVQYDNQALMSYSLVAFSPYEGWNMRLTGSRGRLEVGQALTGPHSHGDMEEIRLFDENGVENLQRFPKGKGSHGGGDEKLLRMLLGGQEEDPLLQFAGSREGVMSAIIGIAANESIRKGRTVSIKELLNRDIPAR